MRTLFITLFVAAALGACGSGEAPPAQEATPAAEPEASSEPQVFESSGTIEAIDMSAAKVTLNHEDITGFMNAMTMAFDVKDTSQLEALSVGDEVEFSVVVEADGTYYIGQINAIPE